jgi:hypothetical protein
VTAIINTIWGGKVSQAVDRHISQPSSPVSTQVVDSHSNKICILLANDALVSIAYTGVAVANCAWVDCLIASALAHRQLSNALAQPTSPYLSRPLHIQIQELSLNLNAALNSDARARLEDMLVSIVGWHRPRNNRMVPLSWTLRRGAPQDNGMRYFELDQQAVGKFLRQSPNGFWGETMGDVGRSIDERMNALRTISGWTHDDVERHIHEAIHQRSTETMTVSPDSLAVQLDLLDSDGQAQVTHYRSQTPRADDPLLSPWVLTPHLISSPTLMSSEFYPVSPCGKYVVGGFEDPVSNLKVRLRIAASEGERRTPTIIRISTHERPSPP